MPTNSSKLASASRTPTGILFFHNREASSPQTSKLRPPSTVSTPLGFYLVNMNFMISCADPPDSCAIPWKSVISWVGWGNGWDVAHAPWNRARMATLMPNTVEKRLSWLNKGWMKALVALRSLPLTACGVRTALQLQFSCFFSSNRRPVCGVKECLTPELRRSRESWLVHELK